MGHSETGSDTGDDGSAALLPGAVDARFTLAAERTMLAWLRTAMGFIASGVAVLHIFDPFESARVRVVIGTALVLVGAAAAVVGVVRWRRVTRALAAGEPMPGPVAIMVLVAVLVAIALGFVVWQ
ncbi:YidH family protein [Gordonia crocea]|uniref:Membrane protein n=1 Tax=Gordonia crocea TaxID=589162 RepID=A0A7I9UXV9_9ACTN|nr:DUF202 domain-containing protein [Gordonia crocea]GED97772.1 membrane protein [Gordonia crocea]